MPGTASLASASAGRPRRSSRRRPRSSSPESTSLRRGSGGCNNNNNGAASHRGCDDDGSRLPFDWRSPPSAHGLLSTQHRSKSLPVLLRLSSREQEVWLSGMLGELSFWEGAPSSLSPSPSATAPSSRAALVDSASSLLKSLEQRQEAELFSGYDDGSGRSVNSASRSSLAANERLKSRTPSAAGSMLSSSRAGLAAGPSQLLNSGGGTRRELNTEEGRHYYSDSVRKQERDEEKKVEALGAAAARGGAGAPVRVWKSAVDPSSGRTYYYDAVTRQTQWEKPEEVRAEERRAKEEKRRFDLKFFEEVRANVMASLERGELIPGVPRREVRPQGPPLEPLALSPSAAASSTSSASKRPGYDLLQAGPAETEAAVVDLSAQQQQRRAPPSNSNARIRTISGMNEKLLAELHNPASTASAVFVPASSRAQLATSSTAAAATAIEGRPPLPRGRSQTYREERATSAGFAAPPGPASLQPPGSPSDRYFAAQDSLELSPDPGASRRLGLSTARADGDHAELEGERLLDGPIFGGDPPSGHAPLSSSASSSPSVTLPSSNASTAPSSSLSPSSSHVRRNTGGTVFVQSTMENPDINATIKCVCGVYRAHIVSSCTSAAPSSSGSSPEFGIFRDETSRDYRTGGSKIRDSLNIKQGVPSLEEIENFYMEFFRRSQMEQDTIIMSLIYVERLIKETNGRLTPSPFNWKSILFSCMVLSSKVWDDLSMFNLDFSNVSVAVSASGTGSSFPSASSNLSAFSLQRTNALEVALLQTLNFNVRVAASEYAKYYFLIRTMLIRSGLLDERGGSAAAKSAGGQLLENRSSRYQDQLKRRAKSVDWTFGSSSSLSEPVLKDSVCLEQLLMGQRS